MDERSRIQALLEGGWPDAWLEAEEAPTLQPVAAVPGELPRVNG
jgi:hypothetical protein